MNYYHFNTFVNSHIHAFLVYMVKKPFVYLRDSKNNIFYFEPPKNQDGDLVKLKINPTNSYREDRLVETDNLNALPYLNDFFKVTFNQYLDFSSAKRD